jgi:hypothetical protein
MASTTLTKQNGLYATGHKADRFSHRYETKTLTPTTKQAKALLATPVGSFTRKKHLTPQNTLHALPVHWQLADQGR